MSIDRLFAQAIAVFTLLIGVIAFLHAAIPLIVEWQTRRERNCRLKRIADALERRDDAV